MNGVQLPVIVGEDPELRATVARASRVAPTRLPVLIGGESGTGKELLAELIHGLGPCSSGPLVAVNCGALPRELAESELFGHERGAFTGAGRQKAGWFEEADGGTLVLDEVGELPLDLQPKLLRVLETGRLRRVGGSGEVAVKVRIVAMTLRDLRQEVARGRFRVDLYHRLAGFELTVPPLRRRTGDIPQLADHFLSNLDTELAGGTGARGALQNDFVPRLPSRRITAGALEGLQRHDWPGNVRELRNVLRRACVLGPRMIDVEWLELPDHPNLSHLSCLGERARSGRPNDVTSFQTQTPHLADADEPGVETSPTPGPARDGLLALGGRTFDEIERAVFGWALDRNGGSRRRAARALGVPRSSFCDKVKRYGLP
ncbi:MAG: sigma-54 dependent transcriptional regulator [Myxococcales bacterium]